MSTGHVANLTNREADVAIGIVSDRKPLPLDLHVLKGPEMAAGVYISGDSSLKWRRSTQDSVRPIIIGDDSVPDWVNEGVVHASGIPFVTPDADAQIAAVRQGIGMTRLPCFVGDADPLFTRV
ncbi:LysR family transcriptional regulator [Rhizobium sp. P38BS-XIX]|nr:LysR family transcriptional regulator [Rhizobium sp. P38BS-XIX]